MSAATGPHPNHVYAALLALAQDAAGSKTAFDTGREPPVLGQRDAGALCGDTVIDESYVLGPQP